MAKATTKPKPVKAAKPIKLKRANVLEVYQSSLTSEWYWRVRGKNGKVVAIGGEGFKRKTGATGATVVKAILASGMPLQMLDTPMPVRYQLPSTLQFEPDAMPNVPVAEAPAIPPGNGGDADVDGGDDEPFAPADDK